jgi:hypothetical protein
MIRRFLWTWTPALWLLFWLSWSGLRHRGSTLSIMNFRSKGGRWRSWGRLCDFDEPTQGYIATSHIPAFALFPCFSPVYSCSSPQTSDPSPIFLNFPGSPHNVQSDNPHSAHQRRTLPEHPTGYESTRRHQARCRPHGSLYVHIDGSELRLLRFSQCGSLSPH